MDTEFIKKFGIKKVILVSLFLAALAIIVYANFPTWNNPTSCAPQPPSSGWTNCTNANTYFKLNPLTDINYAKGNHNTTGVWGGFNFNIPSSNAITGVVVRLDGNRTLPLSLDKPLYLRVRISKDGGANWGPYHYTPPLGDIEQTYLLDFGTDYTWTPADFSNSNFIVEVSCTHVFNLNPGSVCALDWVSVEVKHEPQSLAVSSSYFPFVSDETVLQRGDWLQTEEQFVSHQGNPSQYAMMRGGSVTGISIHCERAPSSCSSNPIVEARITAGGGVPPSSTPVISVSLPNNNYRAYNVAPSANTFNAGDTISVYAQDYGTCTSQPAWCTVLVETSTTETGTISIP